MSRDTVVLDASAIVDLLINAPTAPWLARRLADAHILVPGHLPAEVLSALGRRHRAGHSTEKQVATALQDMREFSVTLHDVSTLLQGAWARRDQLRLADALYVELAHQFGTVVITSDRRLALATPLAVAPPG